MPDETPKQRNLRQMRERLLAKRYTDKELRTLSVADTDGRLVRLADPDALAVIDRRIAAEA